MSHLTEVTVSSHSVCIEIAGRPSQQRGVVNDDVQVDLTGDTHKSLIT